MCFETKHFAHSEKSYMIHSQLENGCILILLFIFVASCLSFNTLVAAGLLETDAASTLSVKTEAGFFINTSYVSVFECSRKGQRKKAYGTLR